MAESSSQPGVEQFTVSLVFDAPRDLVWKAWTEPDRLAKWWGPAGVEIGVRTLELRPGGMFHYSMRGPDGNDIWGKFVFREIAPPERQNRWSVGFRLLLAVPAFILGSAISTALWAAAFLGWFAALFTGHMPAGLRKLGLLALRYSAQANAYGFMLLTNRYPYAGPPA